MDLPNLDFNMSHSLPRWRFSGFISNKQVDICAQMIKKVACYIIIIHKVTLPPQQKENNFKVANKGKYQEN